MKKLIIIFLCGLLVIVSSPTQGSGQWTAIGKPSNALISNAYNKGGLEAVKGVQTASSELSKELLQSILADIKKRIVINDEGAKFSYSVGIDNGNILYDLVWEGKDQTQTVRYGQDKNIYSYSVMDKEHQEVGKKLKQLPQYSVAECQAIAKDFIAKAFPKDYNSFRLQEEELESGNHSYSFNFQYHKNDIPVFGFSTNVTINYINGKVTGFYSDFQPIAQYETPKGVITPQEASEAYKNEIGLKKVYTYQYNEREKSTENVRVAFVPGFSENYAIDAKTGNRQYTQASYYGGGKGSDMTDAKAEQELTPLETAEIEKKSQLYSIEKAKNAALKLKIFKGAGYELTSARLFEKDYQDAHFLWSLDFSKDEKTYSIDLNAKDLSLINYFDYNAYGTMRQITEKTINEGKAAAEIFVAKFGKDYLDKVQLNNDSLEELIGTSNDVVRLEYNRIENGIQVEGDGIYISYNMAQKEIASYSVNWTTLQLPKTTKIADEDRVYDQIFNENKIILGYKVNWNDQRQQYDTHLLYMVMAKDHLPLRFAITTGQRIVSPRDNQEVVHYNDIKESKYQSEILQLQQINIGYSGGSLNPKRSITQQELFRLIQDCFEHLYSPYNTDQEGKDAVVWRNLGLLLEGEEPQGNKILTREEVAIYLVQALGYQKIAEKEEIFHCKLADFNQVTKGYKGYVAIADALRILDVGHEQEFHPKDIATREQGLKMIYNYLAFQ